MFFAMEGLKELIGPVGIRPKEEVFSKKKVILLQSNKIS